MAAQGGVNKRSRHQKGRDSLLALCLCWTPVGLGIGSLGSRAACSISATPLSLSIWVRAAQAAEVCATPPAFCSARRGARHEKPLCQLLALVCSILPGASRSHVWPPNLPSWLANLPSVAMVRSGRHQPVQGRTLLGPLGKENIWIRASCNFLSPAGAALHLIIPVFVNPVVRVQKCSILVYSSSVVVGLGETVRAIKKKREIKKHCYCRRSNTKKSGVSF